MYIDCTQRYCRVVRETHLLCFNAPVADPESNFGIC